MPKVMHKEWYGEKIQLIPSAGKLANVWQSYKKQGRIHQAAETDYVNFFYQSKGRRMVYTTESNIDDQDGKSPT